MITINQDLVDIYYKSLCDKDWDKKQIQNYLHYRKRNNMLTEWLAFRCAYDMWIVNNNFKRDCNEDN